MGIAELRAREAALKTEAEEAERDLLNERETADLEASIEEKERTIAAAKCAKIWRSVSDALLAKGGKVRPARHAIGRGSRYAEIIFRNASRDECDAAEKADDSLESAWNLFQDCLIWYPTAADVIDRKHFGSWLDEYLEVYPHIKAQLLAAHTRHTLESTEIYRGKA